MRLYSDWISKGYNGLILPKRPNEKFAYSPEQAKDKLNDEHPHGWVVELKDYDEPIYVLDFDVKEEGFHTKLGVEFGAIREGKTFKTLAIITDPLVTEQKQLRVRLLKNGLVLGDLEVLKHGCFSGFAPTKTPDKHLAEYTKFGELPHISTLPVIADLKAYLTSLKDKKYTWVFPETKPKATTQKSQVLQEVSLEHLARDLETLKAVANGTRDEWLRVLMAAHTQFGDSAKDLCAAWSANSSKFDAESFEKDWKSLKNQPSNPVTYSYIKHLCPDNVYSKPELQPQGHFCKLILAENASQWYYKTKDGNWLAAVNTKGENVKAYLAKLMNFEHFNGQLTAEELKAIVKELDDKEPEFDRYAYELEDKPPIIHINGKRYDVRNTIQVSDKELAIKNIPYDIDTTRTPTYWLTHLNDFCCGDEEAVEWLQQYFACALFGDTKEQISLVIYGASGSNGKSTTVKVLRHVFGDYAKQFPSQQMFSDRPRSESQSEINEVLMSTEGYRLLTIEEVKHSSYLKEDVWKLLVGGADIAGRGVYRRAHEFTSQANLVICTNHKFHFSGLDGGTTRRLVVMPAKAQFDGRMHTHEDFLLRERGEILYWLVQGYKKYLKNRENGWMLKNNLPKSFKEEKEVWVKSNIILADALRDYVCVAGARADMKLFAADLKCRLPKGYQNHFVNNYELIKEALRTLKYFYPDAEQPAIIEDEGVIINLKRGEE